MQGRCEKHLFEQAEDRCGSCGQEFCAECLVYSFGPKRPPFCIPCAVAAAGIRTGASKSLPRREAKRLERERRQAFRRAQRAAASMPAPEPFVPMTPTPPEAAASDQLPDAMSAPLPDAMMSEHAPAGAD